MLWSFIFYCSFVFSLSSLFFSLFCIKFLSLISAREQIPNPIRGNRVSRTLMIQIMSQELLSILRRWCLTNLPTLREDMAPYEKTKEHQWIIDQSRQREENSLVLYYSFKTKETFPLLFLQRARETRKNGRRKRRTMIRRFVLSTFTHARSMCTDINGTPSGGLYGISKHLKSPRDFKPFYFESMRRCNELINFICSKNLPPTSTIQAFDEILDIVFTFMQTAELCLLMTTNGESITASRTSRGMNRFYTELCRIPALSQAVNRLESEKHLLSEEDQMFVRKLKITFEIEGSFLCPDKREQLDHLNDKINCLSYEYKVNIAEKYGSVDIYPSHIDENLVQNLSDIHKLGEKGFRIPTYRDMLNVVLKSQLDDESLKKVYISGFSTPLENLKVMIDLVDARKQKAQLLGYDSYTEAPFKDSISSEKSVRIFLKDLSQFTTEKYQEELNLLKKFSADVELKPWNEARYMMDILNSRFPKLDSLVASYFSLSNCIEGFKIIVKSLFGATIHVMKPAPGEVLHDDVIKLFLHHPDEGDWGFIYLDLFERRGKDCSGSMLVRLRNRRLISPTQYQIPVVVIVCGFPSSLDETLFHSEVEELFHEFGHALHCMLSRTDRSLVYGTDLVFDLLEVPSLLLEYYANDYRVLRMFAKHTESGEEIPEEVVKLMHLASNLFAARDLQSEILKAMLDISLCGKSSGDITSLVKEIKRKYTSFEHVEGTNMELLRFDHLLSYEGVYFSYLYGACYAATIWRNLCQEDPLSMDVGYAIRSKFLQFGGGKDPATMLQDLLGDEAYNISDGIITPCVSSLCDMLVLKKSN